MAEARFYPVYVIPALLFSVDQVYSAEGSSLDLSVHICPTLQVKEVQWKEC